MKEPLAGTLEEEEPKAEKPIPQPNTAELDGRGTPTGSPSRQSPKQTWVLPLRVMDTGNVVVQVGPRVLVAGWMGWGEDDRFRVGHLEDTPHLPMPRIVNGEKGQETVEVVVSLPAEEGAGEQLTLTYTWMTRSNKRQPPLVRTWRLPLPASEADALVGYKKIIQGIDKKAWDSATHQQLDDVVHQLTAAQWADFEKKLAWEITSVDALKTQVGDYLAAYRQRESEQEHRDYLKMRLYGQEGLYDIYKSFPSSKWLDRNHTLFLNGIAVEYGFPKGYAEFEQTVEDYMLAFRTETVKIGLDLLRQYDSALYKEGQHYQDDAVVASLHEQLAPLRTEYAEYVKNFQTYDTYAFHSSVSGGFGGLFSYITREEAMAAHEAAEKHRVAAHQVIATLSGDFPILKEDQLPPEKRLDMRAVATSNHAELKALLQRHIKARRDDIKKTEELLRADPEMVFALDNLLAFSMKLQGSGFIVRDEVYFKKEDAAALKLVTGVISVALAFIASGPPGVIAAVAGISALGIGTFAAYDEFQEYNARLSASGSGLLSESPNPVWLVLTVMGATIDLGMAVKAVGAISPLAKAVEGSSDLARFSAGLQALERAGTIDAKIARTVEQTAIARAKAIDASKTLAKVLLGKSYALPGPLLDSEVYKELVRLAYYKFREVGHAFEQFALEVQRLREVAKLSGFSAEELASLRRAYEQGKAFKSEEELIRHIQSVGAASSSPNAAVPSQTSSSTVGPVQAAKAVGSTVDYMRIGSNGNGIIATIDKAGVVEMVVEAPKGSAMRGSELFRGMMEHFGTNVQGIRGNWRYGDNLAKVNKLVSEGVPLESAVKEAWTARRAAEYGFKNAVVVDVQGPPGKYTFIQVLFSK